MLDEAKDEIAKKLGEMEDGYKEIWGIIDEK